MAEAGFYYRPYDANVDNVTCFLCDKDFGNWEEGDEPNEEHLRHSPGCGWALSRAIAQQHPEYREEFPGSARMEAARKATFANKWPHESKRGWKCKVKQVRVIP